MKALRNIIPVAVGIMLVVSGCGKGTSDPQNPDPKTEPIAGSHEMSLTIPDGMPLRVTLSEMIQTNDNHVGDQFSGTVADPVVVNGETVIPEGTSVRMVITKLIKGGTLKTPPQIAFTIQDITLPSGDSYRVQASEISRSGRSHTDREVGMIGGGAAAGAIVGGLLGHGKGAAIGAVTGAAAGTGAAAATGRQNLVYSSGQTVTFRLRQPLNVVAAL